MSNFEREDRYYVIKRKDLGTLEEKALNHLLQQIKPVERVYAVVESDWPEYEKVWKMIENRVEGKVDRSKWVQDLYDMHDKFGFHETVRNFDKEKLQKMLEFRVAFLEEELNEIKDNMNNPEEVVDGLVDLCVVAIGTLDIFDIDSEKAWNAVHNANMTKQRGIKKERPNPLGLPDLMKPEGWTAPSHEDNHGTLPKADNHV